jgi:serine/threonine protein kinase
MPLSATKSSLEYVAQGGNKVVFVCPEDPRKIIYLAKSCFSSSLVNEYNTIERIKRDLEKLKDTKKITTHQNPMDCLALDWEKASDIEGRIVFRASRAKGDLDEYLQKKDPSLQQRVSMGTNILTGLHFLHANQKCHGDIKSKNILVYEDTNGKAIAKLSDFGRTISCSSKNERSFSYANQYYSPPERSMSQKGEVFSTGLVLIHLLEGEMGGGAAKGKRTHRERRGVETIIGRYRKISNPIEKFFYGLVALFYYLFNIKKGKNPPQLLHHIDRITHGLEKQRAHNALWCVAIGELNHLLKEMIAEDPSQRPTIEKALERYRKMQQKLESSTHTWFSLFFS